LSSKSANPLLITAFQHDGVHDLKVYKWNITGGGRKSRPTEYRIQLTGAISGSPGQTLLVGWSTIHGVFAGFDPSLHERSIGKSSSAQIDEEYLEAARTNGVSVQYKSNEEVVIAFQPEMFMTYVLHQNELHGFRESQDDTETLDLSIKEAISDHTDHPLAEGDAADSIGHPVRREIVTEVRRRAREASFQRRVLEAYSDRCALCGIQLQLVQASHIVPVANASSTDETTNGLALCALHHWAFDRSLVTIFDDYEVQVNENRLKELRGLGLSQGEKDFVKQLRKRILLPKGKADCPSKSYIRRGNFIRGW
jgi:putative restriction endonuclease